MKVFREDWREVTWSFRGCLPDPADTRPRSSLHLRARSLLRRLYPGLSLYEEVLLPGTRLRFDFVLPVRRLVVEVQGRQHDELAPFFHGNGSKIDQLFGGRSYGKSAFLASLERDARKKMFCVRNNLRLALLPHDGDDDGWEKILC